jgi:hypothetical protein
MKREKHIQTNDVYVNTRTEFGVDQQRIDNADPSYTGYKDAVEKNGIR